jgi:glycosyltransferase involved in cell wall biosynthesis
LKALRVGYVSEHDPLDRWSWSGTHFYMLRALREEGLEIVPLGRSLLPRPDSLLRRVARRAGLGGKRVSEGPDERARLWGEVLSEELRQTPCDVVFAAVASRVVARVETSTPIVVLSDATFRRMRGYYDDVTALSGEVAASLEALESAALGRAARVLFPSPWAAESAILDYGVEPARVKTIPFGANLDDIPTRAECLAPRPSPPLRLLFIGRDWGRKGGPIALGALRELRSRGRAVTLTVVGASPPAEDGVEIIPLLDKKNQADRARLRRLLLSSHLFVLPTRADCFSMVGCEAAAHGLPVLMTRTGGVPGVVNEGRNGRLLPSEAGPSEWAGAIEEMLAPGRYEEFVSRSRDESEGRLNWACWGRAAAFEIRGAAAERA